MAITSFIYHKLQWTVFFYRIISSPRSIAVVAILFHYLFTAVQCCCGNILLPSSSFSHSIIATSGNYKFCSSQTAMDRTFYRIISSPLSIAVKPVFTYSRIPKGSRSFIRLSIFSSLPVASTTTLSGATSIIWAR